MLDTMASMLAIRRALIWVFGRRPTLARHQPQPGAPLAYEEVRHFGGSDRIPAPRDQEPAEEEEPERLLDGEVSLARDSRDVIEESPPEKHVLVVAVRAARVAEGDFECPALEADVGMAVLFEAKGLEGRMKKVVGSHVVSFCRGLS